MANPAGDFSVIVREDGISQWAYRTKPLFSYDGDTKLLDIKGIGIDARFRVALITRFFMPVDAAIRAQPGLGSILTTVGGATLYQRDRASTSDEGHDFREDHGTPALGRYLGTTTCDAECTKSWPPYAAPADAQPSGYWEIAHRPDGTRQWMYKGFALYTYAADKPGETRGNQQYELAPVRTPGDAPGAAHGAAAAIPAADVHEEDPVLPKAGAGISALFWHAVVP
jgi:predicted lipoprotein with Yx(FWY)xxD motif